MIGNRRTDSFPARLEQVPQCALAVVDFDPHAGLVHHVGMRGMATLEPFDEERASQILRRYLGQNSDHWDHERFVKPLDDLDNVLVRFVPDTVVTRDQSYRPAPASIARRPRDGPGSP